MVVCTFAGHREVFGLGQSRVVDILERLLEAEQKMICYVVCKGEFEEPLRQRGSYSKAPAPGQGNLAGAGAALHGAAAKHG